jgi:hypothetical protein
MVVLMLEHKEKNFDHVETRVFACGVRGDYFQKVSSNGPITRTLQKRMLLH